MSQTDVVSVSNEMQNHIEKLLKTMDIKDYTIDVSAGSLKGDNFMGQIVKVIVKGKDQNDKDTTLNLIVKSAPQNVSFRTFVPVRKMYDREIHVYSNIFPELKKFQEEKGVLKPFESVPKYYGSTMNDLNETLIMENMKDLGFALHNRQKPLDYNHVLLVLQEYGKLHAVSYALRDQKPELFKKLADSTQEVYFKHVKPDDFDKFVRVYSERALKSLDPIKHKVAYDKFKNYQEKMTDLIIDLAQDTAGKYGVIRHGDCWMNNMLFKYGDSTNLNLPTELCLIDWQLSHVGSPAFDLAYFIFTCTDKELRDQHYDQLIQEYYNSLSFFLRELGSDPEKMLPFEVLQKHLKKYCMYGLYLAIIVLNIMTSEVDESPDFNEFDNNDLDDFSCNSKNEEKYHDRIRGVILDFVKFGYDF